MTFLAEGEYVAMQHDVFRADSVLGGEVICKFESRLGQAMCGSDQPPRLEPTRYLF